MQTALADQFASLWESTNSPPDVFDFLDEHAANPHKDKFTVVLIDQSRRWHTENPISVEEYLSKLPDVAFDKEAVLDLVVGEYRARQASGKPASVDEFVSRFSDLGESLRRRLSDEADSTSSGNEKDGNTGGGEVDQSLDVTATYASGKTILDERIGRYRLVRLLGEGGFGRVWLAQDEELKRQVAVKVPTPERFKKIGDAEEYLAEAQTLAKLDHPNIVPVYDVGKTEDGAVYVVSRFVEGTDLGKRIKEGCPTFEESAQIIATVAQALHHAHEKRLIHRDIKPANLLLEESTGRPFVADFGLATTEDDYLQEAGIAGTPAYMSPEQARGEGHRLDGRCDIFSLGAVFYELLTAKRPFRGSTKNEVLHNVISTEPTPPKEVNDEIPSELQRICLKALSKRASDRFPTGLEFADDLLHWIAGPEEGSVKEVTIVPKGLRSFDAEDADFFLDLLPGPRDREGLPESIRFWKTRIEETDPDKTFTVGLIYGPSGCGKSSLVKAGLLPRLSDTVIPVYVEATPDESETRILRGIRKHVPLPETPGISDIFTALRRGMVPEGKKIVVVLDQFEQWLHANRNETDTELVRALRQCDGGSLQAVCMVRDDFAMAASRFMRDMETRIVEGDNFATVDLFDIDHAKKVLSKFGQAFGRLQLSGMPEGQKQFLNAVAAGLADDEKVVSVRLALFAEMVKSKPWTPATLDDVGGTEGIGVNFLEETFSSRDANPEHRLHQQAARNVLRSLLPEAGTDIKGHMRSHEQLLEASGYAGRERDFHDLLRILDGELRLITPTDPEGADSESGMDSGSKYYQLTHDYLVPSLREWLTRKQKETRKGRAELRLEERTGLWNSKPENRHLPSWWEWASIRALTEKKKWTEPQQRMMQRAGRFHGARFTMLVVLLAAMTVTGLHIRDRFDEANKDERAAGFVTALVNAEIDQVLGIIDELRDYRKWADPKLAVELDKHDDDSSERLKISLALLPTDATQLDYLKARLLTAEPEQVETIRSLLKTYQDELVDDLWQVAEQGEKKQLLQAASALAVYDPDNDAKWSGIAEKIVDALVTENSLRVAVWIKTLKPARRHLIKPLSVVYRSKSEDRSQTQIDLATDVLEQYAADDLKSLGELLLDAQPKQFVALLDEFEAHGDDALALLNAELDQQLTYKWADTPLDSTWAVPSADVTVKIKNAHGMIAERYAFCQTMPLEEFKAVADELGKSGYRPIRLRPYAHFRSGGDSTSKPSPQPSPFEKGEGVLVAAAWTRDSRQWRVVAELSADAIQTEDGKQRKDGFVAVDVAGYIGPKDDKPAELYAALWMKKQNDSEDARFYAGTSYANHKAAYAALEKDGFKFQHSLQAFRGLDGQQKYCGVKNKADGTGSWSWALSADTFDDKEYLDKIHWDIDPSNAPQSQTAKQRNQKVLTQAQLKLLAKPDDPSSRFARGTAYFNLGNDEQASQDFDFIIEKYPTAVNTYQYRAVVHARMAKSDEAKKDLAAFAERSTSPSTKAYLDAVVSAYLGEDAEGMKRLEVFIEANKDATGSLYDAACAYSIASRAFKEKDASKSKVYADRAVALIEQAVSKGYSDYSHMQQDADLDPIRQTDGFVEIMNAGNFDLRYAGVWNTSAEFESLRSHGLPPAEHLAKCQEMQRKGYRIASISAVSLSGEVVTASVWHRPLISDVEKERLTRRQANAAVAALRMGQAEKVWPLLKESPDPGLRTRIIHRLSPMGANPDVIATRLEKEQELSVRRALILALGEYKRASPFERDALTSLLLDWYRKDLDAGIHGATEWVLRRWGKQEALDSVDKELATSRIEGKRRWYVTKTNGHTLTVIPGPVEFPMGSPETEDGRGQTERLHRQLIGRSYAIGSKELTVAQYREFLKDAGISFSFTEKYSPEDGCPQNSLSWYQAAQYCRWLSEQEGIPEEQMCYPPISEIKEGMKMYPDYLQRTGYRLPSEAEWEYACRGITLTSRHYGQTDDLLGRYAWYIHTAKDRTWPVGTLKPSDLGLFDMYGNVYEWCTESYRGYTIGTASNPSEDGEDTTLVDDQTRRVLRGGSFGIHASYVRSAQRSSDQPSNRYIHIGFRPSRTYP